MKVASLIVRQVLLTDFLRADIIQVVLQLHHKKPTIITVQAAAATGKTLR